MANRLILFIFFVTIVLPGVGQKGKQQLSVVFYNVENLFDTLDDKHKNDNEFLPESENRWGTERYLRKLSNLGRVLCAIDEDDLPAVIGFAEVENLLVLEELIRMTCLSSAPYQAILEEGGDPRGIDVGLIYRTDQLHYLSHRSIPASPEGGSRNILYVKLLGPARDTLHLFVNHWKSRAGGERQTRQKRIEQARSLRLSIDSLLTACGSPKILVMGDLNDEPGDESVAVTLGAKPVAGRPDERALYNLFHAAWQHGQGTLWYRSWELYDQIIVSGALLAGKGKNRPVIREPGGSIFRKEWMLDYTGGSGGVPLRTFKGRYLGGFSDHLPVYTVLFY